MKPWEYMQVIHEACNRKEGSLKVDWGITEKDGEKILAFYGSTDKIDWVVNFLCCLVPFWLYKKFFVHIGWALAWKQVRDSVRKEFSAEDKNVTVIGHSYGSALAVFAGQDLNFKFGIKPKLVTFGSVKPILFGVKSFRKCFASIEQYVHRGDFVCHCPPFFRRLATNKIGKSRNIFKTDIWHNDYENSEHYYQQEHI